MAIGIEQLDMNNISKFFTLKKDLKPLLVEIIRNLSEAEREEIGLTVLPEKSQLRALIEQCENLLSVAMIGSRVGQYWANSITKLNVAVLAAKDTLSGTVPQMVEAHTKLTLEKQDFVSSVVTDTGVLNSGTWYGISKPSNPIVPWVPVKVLSDKYWVSTEPIADKHPHADSLTQMYGTYVPMQDGSAKIFTRFNIPEDISEKVDRVDGALYNNIWFGSSQTDAEILSSHLGKEIYFIKSTFAFVDANPPLIPEAGYAWYGDASNMGFLPPSYSESKRIFNIVVALGTEAPNQPEKSKDTRVTSTAYNVTSGSIFGIPPETSVSKFLNNLIRPFGSSVVVKDAGNKILVAADKVVNGHKLEITAEDGVTKATYLLEVEEGAPDNSDTSVYSGLYTISGNTIANVPYNTTVSQFLSNVHGVTGATMRVIDGSGIEKIPTDKLITGYRVEVTAQDGVTKHNYTIEVVQLSSNTNVTSSVYTINGASISNVPDNTTAGQFLANVSKPSGATLRVLDSSNAPVGGPTTVADGYKLEVVAEDGITKVVYLITVTKYTPPEGEGGSFLVGKTMYSDTKPTDSSLTWVPTKVINGYYISNEPMPAGYPSGGSLQTLVGLFNPKNNKIYSRFKLPVALSAFVSVEGALYNNIWFGGTDESTLIASYLEQEVYFAASEYKYVEANPPIIPESGDAWYGSADYVSFLPESYNECKRRFNIVAIMGK